MSSKTNKITVHASFDYKGKTYSPSITLDLDAIIAVHSPLPDLHQQIAKENNIDAYSYEYEMLIGEPLIFSNPQGDAAQFTSPEGQFDWQAFSQYWHHQQALSQLQTEIQTVLSAEDANRKALLEHALLAAYTLGKSAS